MKKEYWYILVAYMGMHLSSFVGVPGVTFAGILLGHSLEDMAIYSVAIWIVFSFAVTLLIVLLLLKNEWKNPIPDRNAASVTQSTVWAILGVFLALFSQSLAANIETWLGIELGSENTQQILSLIESFPIVVLVSSVIGPILEEIVFRKILFGSLYKKFNFFIAALISSIIFALAHMEPEHLLLYSAMGFTFAFLYIKTKRIIVPICAHVAMNTFVVLVQSVYKEDIERIFREADKVQSFIGGFFL
ncbi:CPBP family intramembrane glutamic endopeptidase [Robertmurraya andreesenii]|uniref:Membrane protease YdiL (CAAX protease family) n=1 Tax=Anoxybacillus andreesenii TaxID=1325932 RepID=A0ABT9V9X9_9BACL|nr:type II CAAX endopeptidase family protein [Robertmurraya andreesenii]MDQ0157727.1 membrane protease YdiL (CAAX protease family) [Robertmurraya andreesenii]